MSNSAMVAVAICCILVLLAVFIVLIIVVGSTMGEPKIWMDFVPRVLPPLPLPTSMATAVRLVAATSVLITTIISATTTTITTTTINTTDSVVSSVQQQ
uniref:Uncharacterized protein n=1 Tax=Anopheles dirus TaxID=7168 RepID=A0A182N5F5_9DIPT